MGKGKGAPEGFVAPVTPGRIIIEAEGDVYKRQVRGTLDTAGVAGRTQRRSKYGAKRPKPGQAAPAKKK